MDGGIGVDGTDAFLDVGEFVCADEINLIQHDNIGKGDLVFYFGGAFKLILQPTCINNGDHGVELCAGGYVLIDEKGLGDGGRIGEAGGFDDDGVEFALAFHQAFDDPDQIAPHGAANAAIVHFEHFFIGSDHEIIINADFAELIDNDSKFLAVRLGEDAVQERCLARAEIAGEHGDGNFFGHVVLRAERFGGPGYGISALVSSLILVFIIAM